MNVLLPPGWPRPRGYSNGVAANGRMVFVAGMIGWDGQGQFHTDDFAGQVRQALKNVVAVLAEGGARPEHIVAHDLVRDRQARVPGRGQRGWRGVSRRDRQLQTR